MELVSYFKNSEWESVEPMNEFISPFSAIGLGLGYIGLLGFKVIQLTEFLQQYMPFWAIIACAVGFTALLFVCTLRLAVNDQEEQPVVATRGRPQRTTRSTSRATRDSTPKRETPRRKAASKKND